MNGTNTYNLIDEPWIPVLMRDGVNRAVSLGEVFADAEGAIANLALNPYERVAVFRLLLCIAQAALGPDRLADESAWLAAKDDVGPAASAYLQKWHHRFFLYGPHAFLQPDDVAGNGPGALTSCDKLAFRLASGNNSTLFDHGAGGGKLRLSDAALALGFLTYQNFSSGGLSGTCLWSGTATERSIKGAPCREQSMLFSILLGDNLLDTVWLNLLTATAVRDQLSAEWGVPAWELPELSRAGSAGLATTFLGHLVPLARAAKLSPSAPECLLGGGVVYPQLPEWREPMATVKPNRENQPTYVSVTPSRMPWRDLASILAIHQGGNRKSALALRNLESLPGDQPFVLWTGGLYSEKAKEIDAVEWKVRLSAGLLEDAALARYQTAIDRADRQRQALYFACAEYAAAVLVDEASRFSQPAERVYWDILAQPAAQRLVLDVGAEDYLNNWKETVRRAAGEAYRRACPAMNARQVEAFARGIPKLDIRGDR